MHRPPKADIRRAFERAAPTYDAAADIQRQACDRLLAGLPDLAAHVLLDAGCGTGYALNGLGARFPAARRLALDLSPAMLARVEPGLGRLAGDLERLPIADAAVDLYWSSLAVQWCDLGTALAEAWRVLRPGGRLAVATLGPETFAELRTAFAAADAYRHTLAFLTPDEIAARCAGAGFSEVDVRRTALVSHAPDLATQLKSVKAIGANRVGPGRRAGLMSRAAWQKAEAAYAALRQPAGLPLTYDLITVYARK